MFNSFQQLLAGFDTFFQLAHQALLKPLEIASAIHEPLNIVGPPFFVFKSMPPHLIPRLFIRRVPAQRLKVFFDQSQLVMQHAELGDHVAPEITEKVSNPLAQVYSALLQAR